MTELNMNTEEGLKAELERLKKENEALKAKPAFGGGNFSMKVSDKGVVSIYGLGRFPVSLYPGQWDNLIGTGEEIEGVLDNGHIDEIRAFIVAERANGNIKVDEASIKVSKEAAAARAKVALAKLPARK